MKQPAGDEVAMTKKEKKDHACWSLDDDSDVAPAQRSRWQETKTSSGEDGLSAKPSSRSHSTFDALERNRAWRKPVDYDREFDNELEGLKIGSPDDTNEKIGEIATEDMQRTTCNRHGCCSIPGESCGRNGIPYNGSCILPSLGFRQFLEFPPYALSRRRKTIDINALTRVRPRLSRDIDDKLKKCRPANYSVPSPMAEVDSPDDSYVSGLSNVTTTTGCAGGDSPGRYTSKVYGQNHPRGHGEMVHNRDHDVPSRLDYNDFRALLDLKPKSKKVIGLPWSDYFGQSGRYTGEVNVRYLPHGHGEMFYDRGHVSSGLWYNGVLDTKGSVVKEKYTPDRLPKYSIGDKGSDEDMIIEGKMATAAAVGEIGPNDCAFVRRSGKLQRIFFELTVPQLTPSFHRWFVDVCDRQKQSLWR